MRASTWCTPGCRWPSAGPRRRRTRASSRAARLWRRCRVLPEGARVERREVGARGDLVEPGLHVASGRIGVPACATQKASPVSDRKPRFRDVSARVDFPALDARVLAFWKDTDIFEKSLEGRDDAPVYVFYEGPPTANGMPGAHHVLSRIFKDLFPRYKTMSGYRVPRKAGWDTHGLPVELEVESGWASTASSRSRSTASPSSTSTAARASTATWRSGSAHRAHRLLGRPRRPLRHVQQRATSRPSGGCCGRSGTRACSTRATSRALLPALRHGAQHHEVAQGYKDVPRTRSTCASR